MSETARDIIVGGKAFRCLAPVRTWHSTGLHFLTRMRATTRFVTLHWTAAENSAEQCFANMKARRVSVHFIVDQLGEAWQCCDADARAGHAVENGGNDYGVGIEIINRGHGAAPAKGFNRLRRTELVHGRPVTYGDFYAAQIGTVLALCQSLCGAYGLPLRVPLFEGRPYPTVLPPAMLRSFRGVLGHYNLDAGKVDPAPDLLARVHRHGIDLGMG